MCDILHMSVMTSPFFVSSDLISDMGITYIIGKSHMTAT